MGARTRPKLLQWRPSRDSRRGATVAAAQISPPALISGASGRASLGGGAASERAGRLGGVNFSS